MGRIVLGIVMGYIVMALWVMATMFLAARMLGSPGVSAGWLAINFVLSFVGAYIGGSFALRFGRERGAVAVRGLTVLVLLFGLGTAVMELASDVPGPLEQPTWYTFIIPFIGAAGIMLGGRRRPSE